MEKQTFIIDGAQFSSLEEFAQYFSNLVFRGHYWDGNLDALNDMLRGGFGSPEGGFIIRWEHSALSAEFRSYENCQMDKGASSNLRLWQCSSLAAKVGRGKTRARETLFDTIIEIIRVHDFGGDEAEDGVELLLL